MSRSLPVLLCLLAAPSYAETLADCIGMDADPVRLACYDRVAKEAMPNKKVIIVDSAPGTPATLPVVVPVAPPPSPVSSLSERWELDPQSKAGTFKFREHYPTYILPLFATDSINHHPHSPTRGSSTSSNEQDAAEVKFQISFKTKLAETMLGTSSDLWFGYTQQSHWQLYNGETSREFRETNYSPELILTTPFNYQLPGGWNWRMLNLGLLHQSNGRDEPLSRSWNRAYAQFGLEHGKWTVSLRPWWRLPEDEGNDDNPDIEKYMGHGDLTATWKHNANTVTLLARKNFSDGGKGAVQADWAFPISSHLRGYVQVFSGYGENLLDYNFRQTTLGFGVSLTEGNF